MNAWWTGFMGLHMTMAATMTTLQNFQAEPARQETAVGIVGSSLGALTLLLVTPPLLQAETRLGPIPLDTEQGRLQYLTQAEALLRAQANKTNFTRSWFARGVAFAYTTAAALFVWRVLDRPRGGLRNFVGGLVIGQARIMLHPTGAAEAWQAYQARYLDGCGAGPVSRLETEAPAPQLQFGAGPRGVAFTLRF